MKTFTIKGSRKLDKIFNYKNGKKWECYILETDIGEIEAREYHLNFKGQPKFVLGDKLEADIAETRDGRKYIKGIEIKKFGGKFNITEEQWNMTQSLVARLNQRV